MSDDRGSRNEETRQRSNSRGQQHVQYDETDNNTISESVHENNGESLVKRAIAEGVETERCVVSHYRTTPQQKLEFQKHVQNNSLSEIPLEWVIDIADESNGWFYGTAYHFDDTKQMLHVMVPDKLNPSFDGYIPLDYRTVHLIECVDGKSLALFNKINRDSVVKVRWEVEWFEEGAGNERQLESDPDGPRGRWVLSVARYYIRMANQLLVEEESFNNETRGFVMLSADVNLRLKRCHKGKGIEDFHRLVTEGIVQSTPSALEFTSNVEGGADRGGGGGQRGYTNNNNNVSNSRSARNSYNTESPAKRMADMATGLRECLSDLLEDRDRMQADRLRVARAFSTFVLNGDLDAGLKLLTHADKTEAREKRRQMNANNAGSGDNDGGGVDPMEVAADEAWHLSQKLEKMAMRFARSDDGGGDGLSAGGGGVSPEELEAALQAKKKFQKELDEKEKELEALKSKIRMI